MKRFFLFLSLAFLIVQTNAQDIHLTRNGKITFFSHTSIEDISAVNNEVFSSINIKTGNLQFLVLIKGFRFKKASMQQHFNDVEYMNSNEFPKAEFKGAITDLSKVNFSKDGIYPVTVEGTLTMHGVSNKVKTEGTVTVKAGKISTAAKFIAKLADYKITIPSIVTSKVADSVEISVACSYEPYK